jgi:iron complex transport system substrate-binding protein
MAVLMAAAGAAAADPLRVVSLDQCADQYVLALVPRAAIAGVSHRADDADSELRALAAGLPRVRTTTESVLAARPTVAVRYWGGDPGLVRALERRGVRVIEVEEASTFEAVEANIRRVSAALGQEGAGEALVRRQRGDLEAARGAWSERTALYLTPSGFTAGEGTLIGAILRAAGLRNAVEGASFRATPMEALVLRPPALVVLGFFDTLGRDRWSQGRSGVLRRMLRGRTAASLPAARLHCPGWMAAGAAAELARAAR